MSCVSLGASLYHVHILLTVYWHENPFTRKNYTCTFFQRKLYIYLLFRAHCIKSEWCSRCSLTSFVNGVVKHIAQFLFVWGQACIMYTYCSIYLSLQKINQFAQSFLLLIPVHWSNCIHISSYCIN